MSGSLSEIDLALVIQTITNARKEGTIVISDERYRPIATLFCRGGKVLHVKYKNLTNELALYQIFQRKLSGSFVFQSAREPDWAVDKEITRPTDMLLIEAHRRFDELEKSMSSVGGRNAVYCHAVDHPDIGILPAEARECASDMWQFLDGSTPLGRMWQLVNADDYMIFKCFTELHKTRQIEDAAEMGAYLAEERGLAHISISKLKQEPLPVSAQQPLSPWDTITSLCVNDPSKQPHIREGSLLGALRAGDPWHLVHNLRLLPEANGSPLFKDGCVIGIHCGFLPAQAHGQEGKLQQMLWIEAVLECLKEGGEPELARMLSNTGDEIVKRFSSAMTVQAAVPAPKSPAEPTKTVKMQASKPAPQTKGCVQAARIDCPKCGASSLESARFCKTCGQKLIGDLTTRPAPAKVNVLAMAFVLILVGLAAAAFAYVSNMSSGANMVRSDFVLLPDQPWLRLSINRYAPNNQSWESISRGTILNKTDRIYIGAKVLEPCHVYLLIRPSTSDSVQLCYPADAAKDRQLEVGDKFAYPDNYETRKDDGTLESVGGTTFNGPAATEMLIAIGSHAKLDLSDSEVLNDVFKSALNILDRGDLPQGIEVSASTLSPKLSTNQQDASQSLVYLERLPISHKD
jgi:hypothetical protein